MAHAREDLLTPTLSEGHRPVRLYSPTALFYTSFFGGPASAIAFSWLNTKQLGRTREELRWYVLAAVASVAWIFAAIYLVQAASIIPDDLFGGNGRTVRYLIRGFGLLVWGGFYFLHRPFHRTNDLAGAEPLGPWGPAIGCIIAGIIVHFVVISAAKMVLL